MLYPVTRFSTALACRDERTTLPLYLVVLLVNNMTHNEQPSLDNAYTWLKRLPPMIMAHLMNSLPAPVLAALKERVVIIAIEAGDDAVVQSMLALNIDVRERVRRSRDTREPAIFPLQIAMVEGHFSVTKIIVKHLC
jgi:hypothetical protein